MRAVLEHPSFDFFNEHDTHDNKAETIQFGPGEFMVYTLFFDGCVRFGNFMMFCLCPPVALAFAGWGSNLEMNLSWWMGKERRSGSRTR